MRLPGLDLTDRPMTSGKIGHGLSGWRSRAGSSVDARKVTYDSHDALLSVLTQKAIKWRLHAYLTGEKHRRVCVYVMGQGCGKLFFCLSALPDLSGCLPLTCTCTYMHTWGPNRLNCTDSTVCRDGGRCIISEPWNKRSAFRPFFSILPLLVEHCRSWFLSASFKNYP